MGRPEGSKDKHPRAKRGSNTPYTELISTRVTKRVRIGMYKVNEPLQKFIDEAIETALIEQGFLKPKKHDKTT